VPSADAKPARYRPTASSLPLHLAVFVLLPFFRHLAELLYLRSAKSKVRGLNHTPDHTRNSEDAHTYASLKKTL
jgi:hypothetical protein